MQKIILKIDGMTCSACSNGLEKHLNKQKGIISASVNLVMANALIEYDENILDQKKIEKFIKEAGFKSLGIEDNKLETNQTKRKKWTIGIFSLLAIFFLYISMGHMFGIPVPNIFNMHINPISYTTILCILTIIFLIYGADILKNGIKNLIHRVPNMDTLVAIGVISSIIYSIYRMVKIFQGDHAYVDNLYFESAAIVIFFIKLGRYIDSISKDKTKDAIKQLVQITPNKAIIKRNGEEIQVTLDEIQKGDIVISRAGDKIAVDGTIINGKAHLDDSFITGESKPVAKKVGDTVIAGSINFDGYLEYQAERIGKDSTISEIVRLVVEATNTKAPIAKLADKVSGYFVPLVIILAVLTGIVYLLLGEAFQEALSSFITVLVVACPCALGLATPLAIVVSEGVCARNGILVKKSEILENAAKIDTIVFDKTGTLTYGNLKIADAIYYTDKKEELLQIVGSIEIQSNHPISQAFKNYIQENQLEKIPVDKMETIAGKGIVGTVKDKKYLLGNAKLLEHFHIENTQEKDAQTLAQKGDSIIYVVEEKQIVAIIGVNDVIRENVQAVIKKLQEQNIETIMLTGDNQETAELIGKSIGIDKIIANVLPAEKANIIKQLQGEGRKIMMCGDGINDSPALANALIGVSINSGTDIAIDSSGVILMKNDLNKVIDLIHISKNTIKNIKQNLFWAFFYNALMIPIAIGILKPIGVTINPMIAGMAMVISSLTVILNALRLKRIKLEGGK